MSWNWPSRSGRGAAQCTRKDLVFTDSPATTGRPHSESSRRSPGRTVQEDRLGWMLARAGVVVETVADGANVALRPDRTQRSWRVAGHIDSWVASRRDARRRA